MHEMVYHLHSSEHMHYAVKCNFRKWCVLL